MAKKKIKLNINYLTLIIALAFGITAVLMIFSKAIIGDMLLGDGSKIAFKGTQLSFGFSIAGNTNLGTVETPVLSANPFSIFAFLFPLLGLVLLPFSLTKKAKIFNIICGVIFVVSAFCALIAFTTFNYFIIEAMYKNFVYRVGIGLILSGVFSMIAGLTCLFRAYMN